MKIQYASDLHLEFTDNSKYIKEHPLKVCGDILVLAGDIMYLGEERLTKHPFWNWASDNYAEVLVVPGNHELYNHFDINLLCEGWEYKLRSNVRYCYNKAVSIADGAELLLTTLWSRIKEADTYYVEHGVSDFYRILDSRHRLSSERFNIEHERCLKWLQERLAQNDGKRRVVVTHHVPSFLLSDPAFKGSLINGAFTVELYDFIERCGAVAWIYGHSHRNIDALIGTTQCLSNQLGYVMNGEHRGANGFPAFSAEKWLEV